LCVHNVSSPELPPPELDVLDAVPQAALRATTAAAATSPDPRITLLRVNPVIATPPGPGP
jgi:hypothetical protein